MSESTEKDCASELRFTRDETANTDPAAVLPEHAERFLAQREMLDESH